MSNYLTKTSIVLVALVAGVCLVQAAGGIKGQRNDESQRRFAGIKGPRVQQQQQQQQQQQPQLQQQSYLPPPRPIQPIEGPGKVAPVFTPSRVQPIAVQQQQFRPQPQPQPLPQQQLVQVQEIQQQEQEPEPQQQQQQQQQESEIDPNAAAQDSAPAIAAPANNAAAAASEEEANPRPEPYAFNYAFDAGDSATSGSSQREEQQDASGKVTGFYTLRGEDGRDRRVDYIADANGFRATITTNELGTAPKNSADVDWQAQNPSEGQVRAAESATQAARQRALLNPQQSAASTSGSLSKVSSPRQNGGLTSGSQQRESFAAASKGQQQLIAPPAIAQLQEPFEQIRQTELNARARKSRHAPFYLYTV